MSDKREAKFVLVIGKKGVGKTYETLKEISSYLKKARRKVLILDVNNEYGNVQQDHNNPNFPNVRALAADQVLQWMLNGIVEARRLLPVNANGTPLTDPEMQNLMKQVIKTFKNGALILEDITKIVSDSTPNDLIGALATQRHASLDIYIHFQSIQKAGHPKLWALSNLVRMHKCEDEVSRHANKFPDVVGMYLTENIVAYKFKNNKRFCAFYWKEDKKIKGLFDKKDFGQAIEMYLQDNPTLFKKELNRIDLRSGKRIHKSHSECLDYLLDKYTEEYYGNEWDVLPKNLQG
jgi:hypothetical protein